MVVTKKSAGSFLRKCTCVHNFQDATYGAGVRVFTRSGTKSEAHCTVCRSKVSV